MGYEFIPKDNIGAGDVVGPGSATDRSFVIFDGSPTAIKSAEMVINTDKTVFLNGAPIPTGYDGYSGTLFTGGNDTADHGYIISNQNLYSGFFIGSPGAFPSGIVNFINKVGSSILFGGDGSTVGLSVTPALGNIIGGYVWENGTNWTPGHADDVTPLTVLGTDSQTANLIDVRNPSGTSFMSLEASGKLNVTGDLNVSGTLFGQSNIQVLNAGYLVLANAANDGSINLQAPPGLVGQFFITMPSTAGAAGTTFMNAGGGSMSWSNDFTAGLSTGGDLSLYTLGKKISIKEGSNASMGVSTLVGGTVTVSTTAIKSTSRVLLTHQNMSGIKGIVSLGTIIDSVSFEINSSTLGDTSNILWIIIDPS